MTHDRAASIEAFLTEAGWVEAERQAMGADWSTRRYVRLRRPSPPFSAILMDADGASRVQLSPFIAIGQTLLHLGFSAPRIFAANPSLGLAVLEDFGDASFAGLLEGGSDPWPLYEMATDLLIDLHERFRPQQAPQGLPLYRLETFMQQIALFGDRFVPLVAGSASPAARNALNDAWHTCLGQALAADDRPGTTSESLMLRDYHPGNLMALADRRDGWRGVRGCGLLDFQDAGVGPISYDPLSLLQDARRDVPPAIEQAMLCRYLDARPAIDPDGFRASYAIMGAMRHGRILGRVAELVGQGLGTRQAEVLERVWHQFRHSLRYPALAGLDDWVTNSLPADGGVPLILASIEERSA
jgi:N-acetylmuramate 1-kinase